MLPENLKSAPKAERLAYLSANKRDILRFHKTVLQETDCVDVSKNETLAKLAFNTNNTDDLTSGKISRTIVGNTYNWIGSQQECLMPGCLSKTIKERQGEIWHFHDHVEMLTARVGDIQKIYEQNVSWADLGLRMSGGTQCVMFDTDILERYNPMLFMDYVSGKINQHSLGLYYLQEFICIDDPDYKEEFANWQKYIQNVGNKKVAMDAGYFFAVTEGKLIELSCVLKGSNILTPTLPNIPPVQTTVLQSPQGTENGKINHKLIYQNLF